MPRARPARTVLEFCVARAGLLNGARLAEFVCTWAIASRDLGHPIGPEELVTWWGKGVSRRTIYRRLSEFRRSFPELESPQPIADAIAAQLDARVESAARLASLPLDLGAVAAAA
jgi:hypothetical protein